MLKNETGKSISEYVLIFALVVLVAIPAVIALGQTTSGLIDVTGQSKFDSLISLIDTGTGGTGGGVGAPGGGAGPGGSPLPSFSPAADSIGDFQQNGGVMTITRDELVIPGVAIDMDVHGADGGDSIVLATSVLSDQMAALADEMEAEGAPGDLIQMLRDAASAGYEMRDAGQAWNDSCDSPERCAGNLPSGVDPNTAVYNAHWNFTVKGNTLIETMKMPPHSADSTTDPVMQKFFELSKKYVGGIDEVNATHYATQVAAQLGKTDSFGNVDVASTNINIMDISGVSIDVAPQFTDTTTQLLEQAQQSAVEEALTAPGS